jgi:hypothetical protein
VERQGAVWQTEGDEPVNSVGELGWEHAGTRYMCVTFGVIDRLQRDFFAGRELGGSMPHIDPDRAAVMTAESLEADRMWNRLDERILSGPRGFAEVDTGRKSDFKGAGAAEVIFGTAAVARDLDDREAEENWRRLAMAVLEEILRSPTASPLLWYQDIFLDVAEASKAEGDLAQAGMWLKRMLAHELRFDELGNAVGDLGDLARVYMEGGKLDRGLRMLAALVRHDPGDVWVYNLMAISFDRYGLAEIGAEATRRGLALLDARGDPENLGRQLEECLERMTTSERQGREAEVTPSVLAELRTALDTPFDAGKLRSSEALCRELVPDVDEMPVKRPLKPSDFPLPDRAEILEALAGPGAITSAETPGRNDPCWCGSGKKYKYCHLREDQRRGR